jgi:uncharacterized membrane protein/predicted DsbA family dithiol-disulfide isomerase
MKKNYLNYSLVTVAIAIGLHLYLTIQHYGIKLGIAHGTSVCNLNATFNCDAVAASSYSAIWGLPMAMLGLFANLVLLIYLLVARVRMSEDPEKIGRYAVYFTAFIALVSVMMALISSLMVKSYCLFCMGTYLMSWLGLAFTVKAHEGRILDHLAEDIRDVSHRFRWVLILAVLVPGFAFVGNKMVLDSYGFDSLNPMINDSLASWKSGPNYDFDQNLGLTIFKGTEPAKMTIVEFADFRCPHCKVAAPSLHAFAEAHPDVKFIFKVFPLDGSCNSGMQQAGSGASCKLAYSVFCAEKIAKKGWAAHDYIFEHQEQINSLGNVESEMPNIAEATGIRADDLNACLSDLAIQESVRKMADEGLAAKLEGTPTVYVNGRKLNRGTMVQILQSVYNSL